MVKRTRLPDDFQVSARIIVLAKENGWPSPQSELDAFKDYHLAHGSLFADWEAAFRTWLRNCGRFNKGHPAIVSKPTEIKPKLPPMSDVERRENQRRLNDLITGLAARKGIR